MHRWEVAARSYYGLVTDGDLRKCGFVLVDGALLDLSHNAGRLRCHNMIIPEAINDPEFPEGDDNHRDAGHRAFMDRTDAIRMLARRNDASFGRNPILFLEMLRPPSRAQVRALRGMEPAEVTYDVVTPTGICLSHDHVSGRQGIDVVEDLLERLPEIVAAWLQAPQPHCIKGRRQHWEPVGQDVVRRT